MLLTFRLIDVLADIHHRISGYRIQQVNGKNPLSFCVVTHHRMPTRAHHEFNRGVVTGDLGQALEIPLNAPIGSGSASPKANTLVRGRATTGPLGMFSTLQIATRRHGLIHHASVKAG